MNKEQRIISVGKDFPMSIGNALRVSSGSGLLEYFVSKQLDAEGTRFSAEVSYKEKGTNKEGISQGGGGAEHVIERLRGNRFPSPEEAYKRMERD